MFMLRSTHDAAVKALREEHAMHLAYKDSSRADMVKAQHYLVSTLEQQIQDLKRLVFAPQAQEASAEAREADRIITQNQDVPESLSESDLKERDQLFSGTWDEVVAS